MAARQRKNVSEQDSDYDGAWKEVLRQHLRGAFPFCANSLALLAVLLGRG